MRLDQAQSESTRVLLDKVEFATSAWANWFNNKRLLEPIGNRPPAEKEDEYYQQLKGSALAA